VTAVAHVQSTATNAIMPSPKQHQRTLQPLQLSLQLLLFYHQPPMHTEHQMMLLKDN
jgi:hypothetical protein